eukprot:6978337-Pyramimonas_sp.AAC.1
MGSDLSCLGGFQWVWAKSRPSWLVWGGLELPVCEGCDPLPRMAKSGVAKSVIAASRGTCLVPR